MILWLFYISLYILLLAIGWKFFIGAFGGVVPPIKWRKYKNVEIS
jgi:hypothetical protein